jgi:hypothetical protein
MKRGKSIKARILFFITITFFSLPILFFGFEQQKTHWKGIIEYEDGVKVIRNPNEPLYGEIEFELEEDLSVGNEEDENYMFYGFVKIAISSEEKILVLDGGNGRILKFDRDGNYIQTIGRKGQGPGEFEAPWAIYLDSKDQICVYDSKRRNIQVFDNDGNFKKVIKPPGSLFNFGTTKDGNVLMIYSSFKELTQSLILIDPEGNLIKTIAGYAYQPAPSIKGHVLGNPYNHSLHLFPLNRGGGIYGHSSQYKLFVISPSGNLSHIIEVEKPPKPISKKDKDSLIDGYLKISEQFPIGEKLSRSEVKKAYIFPEFKPFFNEIFIDSKDRIYVRIPKSVLDKDESPHYDLFNKEGYFLYRVKILHFGFPKIIKNGNIYTHIRDSVTGYIQIKRYKIINWEQIREKIENSQQEQKSGKGPI